MIRCDDKFMIPSELEGEDVYDMHFVFDNEDEALEYVVSQYNIDRDELISELYEEESMRNEFGRENYLRTAQINITTYLNELLNGKYILWEAY